MCGIAGTWMLEGTGVSQKEFIKFLNSLSHRGPDGYGVSKHDNAKMLLGHRRLSILDLSAAGRQPMRSPCGRYFLTFNGEIFNYVELRNELKTYGFKFCTETDSEVLLASFIKWGEACQLKFNGMWAFAIWDDKKKELFLSRDRFGVKPLYFYFQNSFFAFASELKAFLFLKNVPFLVEKENLSQSIENMIGMEGTEKTWLKNIKRLRGGHQFLLCKDGKTQIKRYWNTLDHIQNNKQAFKAQVETFKNLFFDSCRLRLRSDVPVATSLSGGLDSSSVFAALHKIDKNPGYSKNWKTAFIAGFKNTKLDEKKYALEVTKFLNAPHKITEISKNNILNEFEKAIYHFEDVNSVLPLGIWCNYKAIKKAGFSVSLDGHGADEMLGGYNFISEHEMLLALEKGNIYNYLKYRKIYNDFSGGSGDMFALTLRKALKKIWRHTKIAHWFRNFQSKPSISFVKAPLTEYFGDNFEYENDDRFQKMSSLNQKLYIYFHYTVLPTILRNFDRGSMGQGVEARMPFMDWRLVVFCFGLPDNMKIGGGYPKKILREAMNGLLPDNIRLRTNKIGFTSPMAEWAQGPLKEIIFDSLHDKKFQQSEVFDGKKIMELSIACYKRKEFGGFVANCWPAINAYLLNNLFNEKRSRL